jgi:16S rRNA G966 N2-methylase RsmD
MEILAGLAKGLKLSVGRSGRSTRKKQADFEAEAGKDLRPTPVRVRKAMADSLKGVYFEGTIVDLFAGCGSMGLEFLSRGAVECVFVERSPDTGLDENIDAFREREAKQSLAHAKIRHVRQDVFTFLQNEAELWQSADLIWADMPFRSFEEDLPRLITLLDTSRNALAQKPTLVCLELEAKQVPVLEACLLNYTHWRVQRLATYGRVGAVTLKCCV